MSFIEYTDNSLMPWGKHRNKKMGDIKPSYFKFIYDKFKWGTMKPMGEESLAVRRYITDKRYHLS